MNPTHEHPQTQSSIRTTDKERRQRIPSIPYSIVKEQKRIKTTRINDTAGSSDRIQLLHEGGSFTRTGRHLQALISSGEGGLGRSHWTVNPRCDGQMNVFPRHPLNQLEKRGIPTESGVDGLNPAKAPIASTSAQVSKTSAAGRGADTRIAFRPSDCSSKSTSVETDSLRLFPIFNTRCPSSDNGGRSKHPKTPPTISSI